MNKSLVKSIGTIPAPPMPMPPKTNLFPVSHLSTWSYFARNYTEANRQEMVSAIAAGKGNSIIALMSNADENAPVSFWEDVWGGTVNMAQLNILEQWARKIAAEGGMLWPCFFCDDTGGQPIRDVPMEVHQRALSILIAHLRPYVPGFCIGLESSEYWDCAKHNEFAALIRYLAPDRLVVSHLQDVPRGGVPDLDAVLWEADWQIGGPSIAPDVLVAQARAARVTFGEYIWPVEYDLNPNEAQSEALLKAGFGSGGPCR